MGCSLTKKVINIKHDQPTDIPTETIRKVENDSRTSSIEKKYQISGQTSIIIEQVSQNRILDNIMRNLKNKAQSKIEIPMESPRTKSPVQGILKYNAGSPYNSKNNSSKRVNFIIEKQDSIDEGQLSNYGKKKYVFLQYKI